jgi:hypothetical protein
LADIADIADITDIAGIADIADIVDIADIIVPSPTNYIIAKYLEKIHLFLL